MWRRADSVWTIALASMPESEQCAWLDPSILVPDEAFRAAFLEASCSEQIKLAERVWWLSDPLYTIDGNERRSEHLARVTELILSQAYREHRLMTPAMARAEKGIPLDRPMVVPVHTGSKDVSIVGADTPIRQMTRVTSRFGYPELVMRVGVPEYTAPEDDGFSLIAQYHRTRVAVVPRGAAILNPLAAQADDWKVNEPRAHEFMSAWPMPMRDLEYQLSYFRRGDSARIVAATDISRDSLLSGLEVVGSLVLQREMNGPQQVQEYLGRNMLRFDLTTVPDSTLLSLEVLERTGLTGRVRFGSVPPDHGSARVTLSDVMLIDNTDPRPPDLEEARWRTLGTTIRTTGSTTALFWEMYGLQPGDEPSISIVVSRLPPGTLERIARAITFQSASDSLMVQWTEAPVVGAEIEPRSISLDLRTLGAGRYVLSVVLRMPGQPPVTSRRSIEIREPTMGRWR
jgi:hypothetical protein